MRKLIVGSLVAAALGVIPMQATARTNVGVYVNFAPPAARYEVIPAPRLGWAWAPGYWDWRAQRYHWVRGHWVRERRGYYYQPARWVHQGGRYYLHRGAWRDSDRDGVPNRYDRAPHNPYRR